MQWISSCAKRRSKKKFPSFQGLQAVKNLDDSVQAHRVVQVEHDGSLLAAGGSVPKLRDLWDGRSQFTPGCYQRLDSVAQVFRVLCPKLARHGLAQVTGAERCRVNSFFGAGAICLKDEICGLKLPKINLRAVGRSLVTVKLESQAMLATVKIGLLATVKTGCGVACDCL